MGMKKILGIFAVAAMMLVACDKDSEGGKSSDYNYSKPKLSAPANPNNNFTFVVDQAQSETGLKNPDGADDCLLTIAFPPGSSGVAEFENGGAKELQFSVEEPTKADTKKIKSGTVFRVKNWKNGITSFMVSIGDLKSSEEKTALIAEVNGNEILLQGTILPEPAYTPFRQDVCRNWEIEETIISVKGDEIPADLGVGRKFTGCKLDEISKQLVDKGVKINTLGSEYNVSKIMISPSGKFAIFFSGKDPYYGDYTLKGTDFSYNFKIFEEDNPILAGSARGKLSVSNGYGRLEVNADLKDNSGKSYSINIIFKMKPEAVSF